MSHANLNTSYFIHSFWVFVQEGYDVYIKLNLNQRFIGAYPCSDCGNVTLQPLGNHILEAWLITFLRAASSRNKRTISVARRRTSVQITYLLINYNKASRDVRACKAQLRQGTLTFNVYIFLSLHRFGSSRDIPIQSLTLFIYQSFS